jgi:ornithine decarboxylase
LNIVPLIVEFTQRQANPDPHIIAALAKAGAGFDCASLQEIEVVLQAGGHPSSILFSNPTKLAFHISEAAARDVHLMVFDSEGEVQKLQRLHPKCKAILRLQVDGSLR